MTTDNTSINTPGAQQPSLSRLQPVKTDNIIRVNFEKRSNVADTNDIDNKISESISDKALTSELIGRSVDDSVLELNNSEQFITRNLEFHIDNGSGRTVITVRDTNTQDVIRQIPSEQLLEISSKLKELQESNQTDEQQIAGILFTSKT